MENTGLTVSAIRTDSSDVVSDVQLSDGRIMPVEEAIMLAGNNQLDGFTTGMTKNGYPTLRGVADGRGSNNLKSLPRF